MYVLFKRESWRKAGIELKVRIFVDGACSENPGPGGWAAVFNTDKECKILRGYEKNTTNNRMELMAVVKSMEKVCRNGTRKNTYEIFSDSAYVVNSINNDRIDIWKANDWKTTRDKDIKNKDLWARYLRARGGIDAHNITLSITKIKGHSGNIFNEYADNIAKKEVLKAKKQRGGYYA